MGQDLAGQSQVPSPVQCKNSCSLRAVPIFFSEHVSGRDAVGFCMAFNFLFQRHWLRKCLLPDFSSS